MLFWKKAGPSPAEIGYLLEKPKFEQIIFRQATPAWAINLLAAALVALAVMMPRLLTLDRSVITDEPLWVVRSARFAYALGRGDFAATYQREHPGVTIMWAGAGAYWRVQPQFHGRPVLQLRPERLDDFLKLEQSTSFLVILVTARRILTLVNTVILTLAFIYARRMIGVVPALIGFLLIALDPFHIALTRVLHLDGLLSSWMLLSTLAWLSFLYTRRKIDLLVSAAAAAFAWLTKSPGFILGPIIGILAVLDVYLRVSAGAEGFSLRKMWHAIRPVLMWALLAALIFSAAWPAMWVQPAQTINRVFSMAEQHAEEGHESAVFFNGQVIPDGILGWRFAYFYPLTYLWRSTPATLAGLALALWAWRKSRWPRVSGIEPASLLPAGLLILAVGFALFMTIGAKKFDRYLLPAYPALDLLAGVGWSAAAATMIQQAKNGLPALAARLILPMVILVSVFIAWSVHPYYLSYYNPLLGGGSAAARVMQVGWGEGLDQAASYLLSKPEGNHLSVVSFYAQGSFSYFFPGETRYLHNQEEIDPEEMNNLSKADYALVYINQLQRNLAPALLEQLKLRTPECIVKINGINYVYIYRLR